MKECKRFDSCYNLLEELSNLSNVNDHCKYISQISHSYKRVKLLLYKSCLIQRQKEELVSCPLTLSLPYVLQSVQDTIFLAGSETSCSQLDLQHFVEQSFSVSPPVCLLCVWPPGFAPPATVCAATSFPRTQQVTKSSPKPPPVTRVAG